MQPNLLNSKQVVVRFSNMEYVGRTHQKVPERPRNMAALPCRHLGMILTMFRHDHGMIMARSWHDSHVFPTREGLKMTPNLPLHSFTGIKTEN